MDVDRIAKQHNGGGSNGTLEPPSSSSWHVEGWSDLSSSSHTSRPRRFATSGQFVILCTNRRLGVPRDVGYTNEGKFLGIIKRGLAGDIADVPFAGKRVVVIGMGAFAIEQMRTSIESGAEHVIILARRHGLISPQIIDYVNFIRPHVGDSYLHHMAGSSMILSMWQVCNNGPPLTPPFDPPLTPPCDPPDPSLGPPPDPSL